jgi:hypothetical protein
LSMFSFSSRLQKRTDGLSPHACSMFLKKGYPFVFKVIPRGILTQSVRGKKSGECGGVVQRYSKYYSHTIT